MVTKTSSSTESPPVVTIVIDKNPKVASFVPLVSSSIPQTALSLNITTSWTVLEKPPEKVATVAQQYANLDRAPNFTDATLKIWAENQLSLQLGERATQLNLSNCHGITNASIPTLEKLVHSLKSLNLKNTRITEVCPYSPLYWIDGLELDQNTKHTPRRDPLPNVDYKRVWISSDEEYDDDVGFSFDNWDALLRYFSGNIRGRVGNRHTFVRWYKCPNGVSVSAGRSVKGSFYPDELSDCLLILKKAVEAYQANTTGDYD